LDLRFPQIVDTFVRRRPSVDVPESMRNYHMSVVFEFSRISNAYDIHIVASTLFRQSST